MPVMLDSTDGPAPAEVKRGVGPDDAFRLLVESVRDYAIFFLDPTGIVTTWNRGAERLKGYTAHEIIGQHFSVFYERSDVESGKPQAILRRALLEGRIEDEGWRVRKDGTVFWADVIVTSIVDEQGRHRGFAKVTRDVTERRQAEEERVKLARAETAVRVRDGFIAIAAHELRTPLHALHMQLLALGVMMQPSRLGALDAVAAGARVERLLRLSTRAGQLIARLLDISRLSRETLLLEKREMELVACVREVIAMSEESDAGERRRIAFSAPETATGHWDPLRIEQVVSNLVDNAIRYGGQGAIEVRLTADDDSVSVRVRDEGPGIAVEHRERIFERFGRVNSRNHDPGLGLGLFVSREIVEGHGGTLVLEDTDAGASFLMRLPRAMSEAA